MLVGRRLGKEEKKPGREARMEVRMGMQMRVSVMLSYWER